MLDKNDLVAIADLMDVKLSPINTRLGQIENRLDTVENELRELKEAHEETRSGVNSLLEWAEECADVIKFPLPKVK